MTKAQTRRRPPGLLKKANLTVNGPTYDKLREIQDYLDTISGKAPNVSETLAYVIQKWVPDPDYEHVPQPVLEPATLTIDGKYRATVAELQEQLAEKLGFKPTVQQTVQAIISERKYSCHD